MRNKDRREGSLDESALEEILKTEISDERREFLRKTAVTGLATTGGASLLPSIAEACDHPEGDYQDENYTHWMGDDAQVVSDKCENNFNTATRIDSAGSLIYWKSSDWGDGTYSHHFSNHCHAEHFNQDTDTCEWNHGLGLYQQRWSARDDVEGNEVTEPPTSWVGVLPKLSKDDDVTFGNTAFTGLSLAIAYFWPASTSVVTASQIVYALISDLEPESTSMWDVRFTWDYGYDYQDCLSHYVKFNADGVEPEADVYTQEGYWNDYHYVEITHHDSVGSPTFDSTSSTTTGGSETQDTAGTASREDVEEGDIIYPDDDQKVRVDSIKRRTERKSGGPKEKVDPEEYKRKFPQQYEERGKAPEYWLHLPATSTVTTLTGTILN